MISPIQKFHAVTDHIATGAQPGPQDFAWLREHGFTAVVNLNVPSARNYLRDEGDRVRALGMLYIADPVDCSKLTTLVFEQFRAYMAQARAGKVFVHCAANIKSTALVYAYRVRELGHDPVASLLEAMRIAELEPKWFEWFVRIGVTPSLTVRSVADEVRGRRHPADRASTTP